MKLSDWITREGLSHQEVGDRIGKSQAAVSRYVAGKRMPDEETLIKIFEVTGGEVSPNDFVALPDLAAAEGESDEPVEG
ncbi:helix-turn-helix domain-containing protein [Bradyrhizobium sp. CAR08]